MSANTATFPWSRPRTLTDRRNEIATIRTIPGSAGFGPRETAARHSVLVDVSADEPGPFVRHIELAVPVTPVPAWFRKSAEAGGRLLLLPFDWNRNGAPTIDPTAIEAALESLWLFMDEKSALPQWTPTDEGGVQLDWHRGGVDLEIEFGPSAPDGYAVFSDQLGRWPEWDGEVLQNIENLRRIVTGIQA